MVIEFQWKSLVAINFCVLNLIFLSQLHSLFLWSHKFFFIDIAQMVSSRNLCSSFASHFAYVLFTRRKMCSLLLLLLLFCCTMCLCYVVSVNKHGKAVKWNTKESCHVNCIHRTQSFQMRARDWAKKKEFVLFVALRVFRILFITFYINEKCKESSITAPFAYTIFFPSFWFDDEISTWKSDLN